MNPAFQSGLIHLIHLLISADGIVDEREKKALEQLRKMENISDDFFQAFKQTAAAKTEREIFNEGIRLLNMCSDEEKIRAIIYLYKISEADKDMDVKEVRLLLYSVNLTNVEFSSVIQMAKQISL